MSSRRNGRGLLRGALGSIVVVTAAVALARAGMPAGAQPSDQFTMTARADAVAVQFGATGAPLTLDGELIYASPSSTQASLDSLGQSTAYASAPYSGDLISGLPGLVNGLAGPNLFDLPDFPGYVVSNYPTRPTQQQQLEGYHLRAESTEFSSTADAELGANNTSPNVLSVTSHSEVTRDSDSGVLRASATSVSAPFSLSTLIKFGELRSTVNMTSDPTQPGVVDKSSSTTVAALSIAGVDVVLAKDGMHLAGSRLLPVDLSGLSKLLADAGISVEYQPGSETATSLQSDALKVTYRTTMPSIGPTTVTLILGRASVSLAASAFPALAAATPTPPLGDSEPVLASPANAQTPMPTAAAERAAATPVVRSTTPAVEASHAADFADLIWFYPILVAAAVAAVVGSRLSKLLAVRDAMNKNLVPAGHVRGRPT